MFDVRMISRSPNLMQIYVLETGERKFRFREVFIFQANCTEYMIVFCFIF